MIKVTKTKIVNEIHRYHLSSDLKLDIHLKNGKSVKRDLVYVGDKLHGYTLSPMYDMDLELLKTTNPYWGDYKGFEDKLPLNVEDIDLSKIIYCQGSSHTFFDMNKSPIPVVFKVDYCNHGCISNIYYDLEKLREYLLSHPNVVKCSEVLDIPYYNKEKKKNKYLDILILPEKEWLDEMYSKKLNLDWMIGSIGYRNIQEMIPKNYWVDTSKNITSISKG